MARIRSIHPGLFTDEAFMQASAHARLLIIGVWTEAFDDGVFEWKPITLKAKIFPNDNVDVLELLRELEDLCFVAVFTAKGKHYGAIRNFQKWQRPKSPNSSEVLPEDLHDYVGVKAKEPVTATELVPEHSGNASEKSPQREEEGGRVEEDRNLTVPCPEADKPLRTRAAYSEEFEAWWKVYPTDPLMSKKDAYTQWKRLPLPDREMAVKSLTAFKAYCASKPDYRPVHANRYLSQRRFDGFGQFVEQSTGKVWVKIGTSQFDAWNTWYQDTQGKSAPRSSKGGWYFPSEYPPTAQRAFMPSEFPTQARA